MFYSTMKVFHFKSPFNQVIDDHEPIELSSLPKRYSNHERSKRSMGGVEGCRRLVCLSRQRVLKELKIEIVYASSPQAKGRIERLFELSRTGKSLCLKKDTT